jgi:hypothetical protein
MIIQLRHADDYPLPAEAMTITLVSLLCCLLNFRMLTSLVTPSPRFHIDMYIKKDL